MALPNRNQRTSPVDPYAQIESERSQREQQVMATAKQKQFVEEKQRELGQLEQTRIQAVETKKSKLAEIYSKENQLDSEAWTLSNSYNQTIQGLKDPQAVKQAEAQFKQAFDALAKKRAEVNKQKQLIEESVTQSEQRLQTFSKQYLSPESQSELQKQIVSQKEYLATEEQKNLARRDLISMSVAASNIGSKYGAEKQREFEDVAGLKEPPRKKFVTKYEVKEVVKEGKYEGYKAGLNYSKESGGYVKVREATDAEVKAFNEPKDIVSTPGKMTGGVTVGGIAYPLGVEVSEFSIKKENDMGGKLTSPKYKGLGVSMVGGVIPVFGAKWSMFSSIKTTETEETLKQKYGKEGFEVIKTQAESWQPKVWTGVTGGMGTNILYGFHSGVGLLTGKGIIDPAVHERESRYSLTESKIISQVQDKDYIKPTSRTNIQVSNKEFTGKLEPTGGKVTEFIGGKSLEAGMTSAMFIAPLISTPIATTSIISKVPYVGKAATYGEAIGKGMEIGFTGGAGYRYVKEPTPERGAELLLVAGTIGVIKAAKNVHVLETTNMPIKNRAGEIVDYQPIKHATYITYGKNKILPIIAKTPSQGWVVGEIPKMSLPKGDVSVTYGFEGNKFIKLSTTKEPPQIQSWQPQTPLEVLKAEQLLKFQKGGVAMLKVTRASFSDTGSKEPFLKNKIEPTKTSTIEEIKFIEKELMKPAGKEVIHYGSSAQKAMEPPQQKIPVKERIFFKQSGDTDLQFKESGAAVEKRVGVFTPKLKEKFKDFEFKQETSESGTPQILTKKSVSTKNIVTKTEKFEKMMDIHSLESPEANERPWGLEFGKKQVVVLRNIPRMGSPEQAGRKGTSVLSLQTVENGKAVWGPEPTKRLKDLPSSIATFRTRIEAAKQSNVNPNIIREMEENLKIVKNKFKVNDLSAEDIARSGIETEATLSTRKVSIAPSSRAVVSYGISGSLGISKATSPSYSYSKSFSPSVSPSVSISPSVSPSISMSPSASMSVSPSVSISPSRSLSLSPSMSPSPSPSPSPPRKTTENIQPVISFGGGIYGGKRPKTKVGKLKTSYAPSLTAAGFGIAFKKTPKGIQKKTFTGLEFRPMLPRKKGNDLKKLIGRF